MDLAEEPGRDYVKWRMGKNVSGQEHTTVKTYGDEKEFVDTPVVIKNNALEGYPPGKIPFYQETISP